MKSRRHVLVIDDEADTLLPVLASRLEPLGCRLSKLDDPDRTLEVIAEEVPDLVLLDLRFPGDELSEDGGTTGGRLLGQIRTAYPTLPVMVFTTSLDDSDTPLQGLRHQPNAWFAKPDFARSPQWAAHLYREISETIESAEFVRSGPQDTLGFVVGRSPEMAEVVHLLRAAARNRLNVLVGGEPGVGKGLVAEAIHRLGTRTGQFVRVDCASLDPASAAFQLFGVAPGTVAGIAQEQPGLIDQADGGTLFLDQVQHLPHPVQQRLCAVMDEQRFSRMGALDSGRPVDIRFLGSSEHSLADLVGDEYLLEPFAQRFAVILIQLPPLRQRMDDLPDLFEALLPRANQATGRAVTTVLRPETRAKLLLHDWPGNVRELENTLLRAVANTISNVLMPDDIVLSERHARIPASRPEAETETAASDAAEASHQGPLSAEAVHRYVESVLAADVSQRHNLLKQTQGPFRKAVLIAIIERLHAKLGRKVSHKDILRWLDPKADDEESANRMRKFLSDADVKLTQLEFNR